MTSTMAATVPMTRPVFSLLAMTTSRAEFYAMADTKAMLRRGSGPGDIRCHQAAGDGQSISVTRRLSCRSYRGITVFEGTELALSQQSMQLRPAGYSRAGLLYIPAFQTKAPNR